MEVNNKTLAKYLAEVRRVEKSRSEGAGKEIRKLYKKLLKDLNGFVGEYYTKYSDDDGILSAAILQQKAKYAAFLEEVDKNINEITPEVSKTIKKTVEDTYKACYKGMVNAFTGAVDNEKVKESFKGLSIKPEVIKAAVENPVSGLTLPERLKKNRQEVIYDIKQNISTALMTGERYDTTAKKIAERLDVSYGKAVRIVRTESHRVEEKGLMDGAEEIGEKVRDDGLVYAVIWRNMGDNRVRPNSRVHTSKGWKTVKSKTHADHVKMEGQIIEAGGYFDLGHGVKAKTPGESGDAANDINCRCYVDYEMMTEEEFIERGGKLKESREKEEKNIEKLAENEYNNLKKSVKIPDDCDYLLNCDTNFENKNISEDVLKTINNTIEDRLKEKRDFSFDEIKVARFNGDDKSVFITDLEVFGGQKKNRLYLNANFFIDKSIEEINEMCKDGYSSDWWKSKSLKDLVNHEIMHAKINEHNSYEKIERLYDSLRDDKRVKGFCRLVDTYPDEFMNEMYVAIHNNENIDSKYIDVYNEYLKEFLED